MTRPTANQGQPGPTAQTAPTAPTLPTAGQPHASARDTINRQALRWAVLPLILSLILMAGAFYAFYKRDEIPELRIAIDRPGSKTQELLQAVANLAKIKYPDIKITLFETGGSEANIRLLERGEIDVAALPADAVTRPDFALIASLFPDTHHLIVRADSGIEKIHDLAGQRIAIPPVTSSANRSFWFLIGQYGLSPERMRALAMPLDDAFTSLRQNRVNAIFVTRPPGDKQIRWLTDAATVRILPIDQAEAMSVRRASLSPVTIPKGIYSGRPTVPSENILSVAADKIMVSRKTLSPELVQILAATMFENRRELAQLTKLALFIKKPNLDGATVLPVHDGAKAFYDRNEPGFFSENAEAIGVLFSMSIVSISFFLWIKRRLEERQKGRIDVYNLELVALSEQARLSDDAEQLGAMKLRLFQMLSSVVRDLDEDKIQGEGFQYFAFTWEATRNAINDREKQLRTGQDLVVTASSAP